MEEIANKSNRKRNLYLIIITVFLCSLVYRLLSVYHFNHSSVLFIGIPTLLAILMVKYVKTPKKAYGIVFQTVTLFLLISAIVLGEGILCIIFTAPIFYAVSGLIVFIYEYFKQRGKTDLSALIIIPAVLLLAQPQQINKIQKTQTKETIVIMDNSPSINDFSKSPNFLLDYPNFFKIGFPKPMGISGNGMNVGDKRDISFQSTTKGIGTLSIEIVSKTDNSITFKPISDDTHIGQWLTWKEMKVEFINMNSGQTEVKWTSQFQCDLGPSWYFQPLEAIAVGIMNKHLINSYFNE